LTIVPGDAAAPEWLRRASAIATAMTATAASAAPHCLAGLRDGAKSPEPVAIVSSSTTSSCALCGRCSGIFARHFITSAASAGGTSGRLRLTDTGSRVICAASVACGDASLNGASPVRSS
jgi:hypothetical protein